VGILRASITVYYDPRDHNLKKLLKELSGNKESRFGGRSMSEIARIILAERLDSLDKRRRSNSGNSSKISPAVEGAHGKRRGHSS
jgi:hypothetical protein